MKQNETLSNIRLSGKKIEFTDSIIEAMGESHISNSSDTPMRKDAFEKTDSEKIHIIQDHFKKIMETMGLDLSDDSLKGSPKRVAKMFIEEIFSGLNPKNKPDLTLFDNKYKYNEMLVEKNISFYSNCEHHFVPIIGKAHVAYISSGKVIGLSKLNRLVEFFAKRPQVQERLTVQIGKELQVALETEDVAIVIDAKHLCVASRGIEDDTSSTVTAFYGGRFKEEKTKDEFLRFIELKTSF